MQIALLRHGKPKFPNSGWVNGSEYRKWLEAFNAQGLSDHSLPSAKLVEQTKRYNSVVCSNLNRAIESANLLGLHEKRRIDNLFREAELPHWNHRGVKLPPALWTAFARSLWLLGHSPNCESLSQAKTRAAQGTETLIKLAEKNSSVLLIGHGFINRYISKELISKGWRGPIRRQNDYWSLNEYQREP
jgi:broad specificity phosphatase PhoE